MTFRFLAHYHRMGRPDYVDVQSFVVFVRDEDDQVPATDLHDEAFELAYARAVAFAAARDLVLDEVYEA